MNIKLYLRDIRKLKKDIESKKRERDTLYMSVMGTSIRLKEVDVQTSGSGDVFGDRMAEVADYDKILEEEIFHLIREQQKANQLINTLKRSEHRAILTDYYINGYNWSQVASFNNYSIQHVYRIHGAALRELNQMESK